MLVSSPILNFSNKHKSHVYGTDSCRSRTRANPRLWCCDLKIFVRVCVCGTWHRVIWYASNNYLENPAACRFLRNVGMHLPQYVASYLVTLQLHANFSTRILSSFLRITDLYWRSFPCRKFMHDVRGSPPGWHILNSINNIGVHLGMIPMSDLFPHARSRGLFLPWQIVQLGCSKEGFLAPAQDCCRL